MRQLSEEYMIEIVFAEETLALIDLYLTHVVNFPLQGCLGLLNLLDVDPPGAVGRGVPVLASAWQ